MLPILFYSHILMKQSLLMLCVTAFVAQGILYSQPTAQGKNAFEGKVVCTVTSAAYQGDMTFYCRPQQTRMEMSASERQQMTMITDRTAKVMYMIIPQAQMYMQMTLPSADAPERQNSIASGAAKGASDASKPQFTSKTKKILGYDCEQILTKHSDGTETELWVTRALGVFTPFANMARGGTASPMGGRGGGPPPELSNLYGGDFFLMQAIVKNADGSPKATFEATSIEKKAVEASLFQPPSGFRKMEMSAMPNK
jgi:hypothetical protein